MLSVRRVVGLTLPQDAAESSESDDDERRYHRAPSAALRQQKDEHKTASVSDHSESEDAAPESDADVQDEPIRAPAVQSKAPIPSAALSASDALSKKSLGGM
jgi:hypothetical protein